MKAIKVLLVIIFATLLLTMGYATFLEQAGGSSYASEHVYATPWFFVMWAALAVASIIILWRERLWRRASVFMLHASLLVILAGSAVTWFTASEGLMHIRRGDTQGHFLCQGRVRPLPFTLTLHEFTIDYYPGSHAPADFVSTVICQGDTVRISMNHILQRQGYRLFQSSFDPDQQGTVLSVRYDPYGTPLTYFGYALLALSMLWVLLARGEEFRRLLRQLSQSRTVLMVVLLMSAIAVRARSVPTISQEKAEQAARMQIIYNDRVAPLSTLAHDFLQKVYGRSSYKGLSPEQVIYGWLSRPDAWKQEPMIKIKDARLRQQLGIEGQYATFSELFDGDDYRLMPLIEANGNRPDKAMTELDEKVGLIVMLTEGQLIVPRPTDVAPLSEAKVTAEILYNTIPFSKILFMVCLTLGFITFFLMLYSSTRKNGSTLFTIHYPLFTIHYSLFTTLLWTLFLFHLFGYCLRWYVSGRIPLGNGYETMIFMALAVLTVTLLLHRRFPFILPFGLLLAGFTLLVSHLSQMSPQITHLMPVLSSPLLTSHVSIIMMAYALLAFITLNGLYALVLIAIGRSDNTATLTLLSRLMLYPAVFFLAAGIFLGALWANVSWGRYWSWDPKETWALITLMVYAVAFHSESIPALRRPAVFHAYLVIAFLAVLMTYFGVNYFLGGMHSYA